MIYIGIIVLEKWPILYYIYIVHIQMSLGIYINIIFIIDIDIYHKHMFEYLSS